MTTRQNTDRPTVPVVHRSAAGLIEIVRSDGNNPIVSGADITAALLRGALADAYVAGKHDQADTDAVTTRRLLVERDAARARIEDLGERLADAERRADVAERRLAHLAR